MNFTRKALLFGLSLTASAGINAEQLGRIFFTPEQRIQIEAGQFQGIDEPNTKPQTVNGMVHKLGGQRTVWINGKPQLAGESDERLPVIAPERSQPIKIKVGQRLLVNPAAQ